MRLRPAFECLDFTNLRRITAACVVAQIQPNIHQRPSGRRGNHILPHAQHLRVVVFHRAADGKQIVCRRRPYAAYLIGGKRPTPPRTAKAAEWEDTKTLVDRFAKGAH